MSDTILIYNPKAARGKGNSSIEQIQAALNDAGIEADLAATTGPGHATELAEEAARVGKKRVLITGGDGSVNEAANGLIEAQKAGFPQVEFGIIPNGRGNDFCFAMKIPRDPVEAVAIIKAGYTMDIDVGYAGDDTFTRCFCNGSGIGVDSAINYHAANSSLNGLLSYAWGVVKAVSINFVQPMARITIDETSFEMPLLLFTAMNGLREGSTFSLAPEFDVTDGLLDICIVGNNISRIHTIPLVSRFFSGQLDHPQIALYKAKEVRVDILENVGLISQVDGETIMTEGKVFRAGIVPEKIRLLAPPPLS